MKLKVLLVDDEAKILKMMQLCLQELPVIIKAFTDPREAVQSVFSEKYDLAFIDLKMNPLNGMDVLKEIQLHSPQTKSIIVTAHGSIDAAVEAVKLGAYDFLQKPFDAIELQLRTQKIIELKNLQVEISNLKKELDSNQQANEIITKNKEMLEVISLAKRVAASTLSVLIEGESGTGKELFARLLHNESDRKTKAFVKVNCAAIPENLLESELFGHVKGAFTGALKDRKGRFELADGGTIFLDEIGELSPAIQAKLLRVLQYKEFERVGESVTRKTDIRVLAATNKNLEEAIAENTFREDLFYRLNSIRLSIPPLRERPEDIPLLVQHFIQNAQNEIPVKIDDDAAQALYRYSWPGNVRELENVIQRAIVLAQNGSIQKADLPQQFTLEENSDSTFQSLKELEKNHIFRVLQSTKDLKEAADILGIDQATLWRKRKRYHI